MAESHLRILVTWCKRRILLRFDNQPAAITVLVQPVQQRPEVDDAIAGNGKDAFQYRIQKAPILLVSLRQYPGTHILAMYVTHARDVLVQHIEGIGTGEGEVAAVQQKADFRTGE